MTTPILTEPEVRALVGRKADYYLSRWKPLLDGQDWSAFNWAAGLLTVFWLAYRKMYGAAAALYGIILLGVLFERITLPSTAESGFESLMRAAIMLICGAFGNEWYFRHAVKQVDQARAAGVADAELEDALLRRGGTSVLASFLFFAGFAATTAFVFWLLGVKLN